MDFTTVLGIFLLDALETELY